MTTSLGLLTTVFILLPGFLLLRFRQSTAEYRDLGTFEVTTISVAYSVVIFAAWFTLNLLLQTATQGHYRFIDQLIALTTAPDIKPFLSTSMAAMVLLYMGVFLASGILVYNLAYMRVWFHILNSLGVTRFSRHLTPWEDFLTINQSCWIALEVACGKTYIGRVGLFSHQPFERNELVLTGTTESPVIAYDADHKKIEFGPSIHQLYINSTEIRAMFAIADGRIPTGEPKKPRYFNTIISLVLALSSIVALAALLAADITQSFPHAPIIDGVAGLFTIGLLFLNLCNLRLFR